jgi:geranylgeranyl diphosphate synthase type I
VTYFNNGNLAGVEADAARLLNFFESAWAKLAQDEIEFLLKGGLGEEVSGDIKDFILRRGKRIRPLLFLATWEAFSGGRVDEAAEHAQMLRNAALALELLHAFVLVHDDVIDKSSTRRGQPTLHRLIEERLGVGDDGHLARSMALVLGDVLFARSLNLMLEATKTKSCFFKLEKLFLEVVRDTGLGELRDIQMAGENLTLFTLEDVERMYHLKTTRYTIELPLVAGYTLADGDFRHIGIFAEYSRRVGLAFQIMNDLRELQSPNGFEDEPEGDLVEEKKTWLFVKTRELLNATDRAFLDSCIESHPRDGRFVYKLKHLMTKAGVEIHAENRIKELIGQAENFVMNSGLQPRFGEKLQGLGKTLKALMFC